MDDIWAEMNQEDSVLLAKFKDHKIKTNIPAAQIPVKSEKKEKKDKDKKKVASKDTDKKKSMKKVTVEVVEETLTFSEPTPQLTFDQLPKSDMTGQEVLQNIGRDVNCVDDASNVGLRKSSLLKLRQELFETVQYSYACYNYIFREVCKTLFKRFADDSEKCRELAYDLVNQFFLRATDIQPVLPYYFPALYHRLPSPISYDEEMKIFIYDMDAHDAFRRGKAVDRQDKLALSVYSCSGKEAAEEIRMLACQGLGLVIRRCATLGAVSILHPYFHEIIIYLQAQVRDTFPELKAEACLCLEILAMQEECNLGMKYFAVALVRAVLPILRHRLAKVRVAALSSLRALITVKDKDKMKGAGSDAIVELVGFREENNLSVAAFYKTETRFNYLAELVNDNAVAVRERLVELITELLTVMGDRYDHQQRLTPYLLDLLTDPAPSVSEGALSCLKRLGQLYEEEHADDIVEKRQYGVDGDSTRLNLDKPPVAPFRERPRIGVRLYVRGQVKRFLFALVAELTSWQSSTRLKSAHLLRVVVYLCEEHLTMDAYKLFPSLIKAIHFARMDGDKQLHQLVLESCEIVGRYTDPETYIHYVLPRLRGDEEVSQFGTDVSMRISILQLLSALLSGSRPTVLAEHFTELVDTLTDPQVIDFEASVSIRVCVLDVILTLLHALVRSGRGKAAVEAHFLKTGRLTNLKRSVHKLFAHLLTNLSAPLEEGDTPVATSVFAVSGLSSVVNQVASSVGLSTGKTTIAQQTVCAPGADPQSAEMTLLKDRSSVALILLSALDSVYAETIGSGEQEAVVLVGSGSTLPSLDNKLCSLVLAGVNDLPVRAYYYPGYMYDLQRLFTAQLGIIFADVASAPHCVLASCGAAHSRGRAVGEADLDIWELQTAENRLLRCLATCPLLVYSEDNNASHLPRISQLCQGILGYCCDTAAVALNAQSGLGGGSTVREVVLFHLRVVLALLRNVCLVGAEAALLHDKHCVFNSVFGDSFQVATSADAAVINHNKLRAVSRNSVLAALDLQQVLSVFVLLRDYRDGVAGVAALLDESQHYRALRQQLLQLLLAHDVAIHIASNPKLDNQNNCSYYIGDEELSIGGAGASDDDADGALRTYPPALYVSAVHGPSRGVLDADMVAALVAAGTPALLQVGSDAGLRAQGLQSLLAAIKLRDAVSESAAEVGAVARWARALECIGAAPRVKPFPVSADAPPARSAPLSTLVGACVGALLDDSKDNVRQLALQVVRQLAPVYIRPDAEGGGDCAFSTVTTKLTTQLLRECAYTNQATGAEAVQTALEDVLRAVCVLEPATGAATVRRCFEEASAAGTAPAFGPASSAVSGLLEHCEILAQFAGKQ